MASTNGDSDNGDSGPKIPISFLKDNWVLFALMGGAIVVLGVLLFWLLSWVGQFPDVPALSGQPSVNEVNTAIGAYLVKWGLVLVFVAFVPALILSILGSFRYERERTQPGQGLAAPEVVKEVLAAIPGLLRIPGGFGVVLILLGILLMAGTAIGDGGMPAATSQ